MTSHLSRAWTCIDVSQTVKREEGMTCNTGPHLTFRTPRIWFYYKLVLSCYKLLQNHSVVRIRIKDFLDIFSKVTWTSGTEVICNKDWLQSNRVMYEVSGATRGWLNWILDFFKHFHKVQHHMLNCDDSGFTFSFFLFSSAKSFVVFSSIFLSVILLLR